MNEKEREQVALFRYGLIAPLLNEQVDAKEYFGELAGKVHSIPYYGERTVAEKTIKEWLLHYRRHGFESLKPKKRTDRGNSRRLSSEDQDQILDIRKKFLHMPVSVFYEHLIELGEIQKNNISYSTINRLLKKHNLVGKRLVSTPVFLFSSMIAKMNNQALMHLSAMFRGAAQAPAIRYIIHRYKEVTT